MKVALSVALSCTDLSHQPADADSTCWIGQTESSSTHHTDNADSWRSARCSWGLWGYNNHNEGTFRASGLSESSFLLLLLVFFLLPLNSPPRKTWMLIWNQDNNRVREFALGFLTEVQFLNAFCTTKSQNASGCWKLLFIYDAHKYHPMTSDSKEHLISKCSYGLLSAEGRKQTAFTELILCVCACVWRLTDLYYLLIWRYIFLI